MRNIRLRVLTALRAPGTESSSCSTALLRPARAAVPLDRAGAVVADRGAAAGGAARAGRRCAPGARRCSCCAVQPVARARGARAAVHVVAVVIDKSPSQTIGDARRQTDGVARRWSTGWPQGVEVRVVEVGEPTATPTARGCSARCRPPSPTCRRTGSAGAFLITDGVVHDVPPRRGARLPRPGPRAESPATPTSATGASRSSPPRGSASSARPDHHAALDDPGVAAGAPRVASAPRRRARSCAATSGPAEVAIDLEIAHGGPNILEIEAADDRRRTDADQQPRRRRRRGHPREPARAAGLGRAARRRAHLAQPPEVRRRRSTSSTSPSCGRRRSRTARRSTNCR